MGGTAAGHKNEIIALGQLLLQTGIGGTDDALGAVAADGIAHALAGGDADAVMSQPVAGTVGDQQRAGFCLCPAVHAGKVAVFLDDDGGFHGLGPFPAPREKRAVVRRAGLRRKRRGRPFHTAAFAFSVPCGMCGKTKNNAHGIGAVGIFLSGSVWLCPWRVCGPGPCGHWR